MYQDVSILPANASETERRGLWAAIAIVLVIAAAAALSMVLVPQPAAKPRLFGSTLSPTGVAPTAGPKVGTTTAASQLAQPVVGGAATPDGKGYWLVASDGGIFTTGDARFMGSTGGTHLNRPIVGMAATPDGNGYWLVASDGGIFTFGDARFMGSTGGIRLNQPIVGMSSTRSGNGYWLVASDGGIFSFGDATFFGSTGGTHLNRPIVGMTTTRTGHGYWFVATDGGIFSFGDARFEGSTGGAGIPAPIIGMATSASGHGYWLGGADGSVYTFGDATNLGSAAGMLGENAAALIAAPSGQGLWVAGQGGTSVSLPSGATYSIAGGGGGGAGSSNSFSFLSYNANGSAIRWNPCQPIHFVTNLAMAPSTASSDILGAMARIQAATGISFVWDGNTTEVPSTNRAATQSRYGSGWAPVLIAWSTPSLSNVLPGGGVLGEGGATWMSQGNSPGVYVTGVVDIDAVAAAPLIPGFGSGLTMGDLLLHELGHVVGLGHTTDTSQIMFPDILTRARASYGAGDLTGFSHLGTSQGCDAPPAP